MSGRVRRAIGKWPDGRGWCAPNGAENRHTFKTGQYEISGIPNFDSSPKPALPRRRVLRLPHPRLQRPSVHGGLTADPSSTDAWHALRKWPAPRVLIQMLSVTTCLSIRLSSVCLATISLNFLFSSSWFRVIQFLESSGRPGLHSAMLVPPAANRQRDSFHRRPSPASSRSASSDQVFRAIKFSERPGGDALTFHSQLGWRLDRSQPFQQYSTIQ